MVEDSSRYEKDAEEGRGQLYNRQRRRSSFGVVQLDGELIPFAAINGKKGAGGRRASKVDR
jgi:hypothetical protein